MAEVGQKMLMKRKPDLLGFTKLGTPNLIQIIPVLAEDPHPG